MPASPATVSRLRLNLRQPHKLRLFRPPPNLRPRPRRPLQLSLNLRGRGVRFGMTRGRITTSSRRFGKGTAQMLKTWCAMVPLRKMYREGADIQEIAARYRDIR